MSKYNFNNPVDDSFQAYLVEGAEFTGIEEYPIIRKEMVPNVLPKKIMTFNEAINYRGDLSETAIYFFSPDYRFERIRRNPKKYISFFKRTAGIFGLDFSVHSDMPIIKQKSQMNDNLSLSYFYGFNGIPIYPAPRGGSDSINDEYLKAFPHETLLVIGVHGFIKEKWQKHEWICWIEKIIKELNPKGLIVVGHLDNSITELFKNRVKFYFYETVIDIRNKKGGDKYVN